MAVVTLPIAQGFYASESLPLSAQRCVNMYPSIPETSTITDGNLFGSAGLELLADAGEGNANRGSHVFNGIPYFVNGSSLYRLNLSLDAIGNETWSLVNLGAIAGESRVSIADNGSQMCIVSPDVASQFNAVIVDTSDVITAISDGDFDGPVSGVNFVDGYFQFDKTDGNKFFISALRDGLSYNALDFANAESDPDPIVGSVVYRNQLFVFGSETMEGFQNAGGTGFPFVRSGVIERKGLISRASLTESEGLLFWLGGTSRERPQILMYDGGRPVAISTRAIEFSIRKHSRAELEAVFSWDYSEDGSSFVAFTFPDTTFIFDLSTQRWHERQSRNEEGLPTQFRASNIVDAYSFLLAGDIFNGNIGRLSKETLTEYGETINREVILPPFDNRGDTTAINRFELVAETGVGLLPEQQGDDPEVRLLFSDDGGRTFDGPFTESLGVIGDYDHRVYWNGLGSFRRSRMFKLSISDPVRISFIKAEVDISV